MQKSIVYKETSFKQLASLIVILLLSALHSPAKAITIDRFEKQKRTSKNRLYLKLKSRYESKYGIDLLSPDDPEKNIKIQSLDDETLWLAVCETGDDFQSLLQTISKSSTPNESLLMLKDELKALGMTLTSAVQGRISNGGFTGGLKCPL